MIKPAVVIVHRGGLGDFLMAWPAMLSICEHFSEYDLFWIGARDRLPWLEPLGVRPCPKQARRAFDTLFSSSPWPPELDHAQFFWFCLSRLPPVPDRENLVFLRGLDEDGGSVSVRDAYAKELRARGIAFNTCWLETWRGHFTHPAKRGKNKCGTTLLFPGAGHRSKQWPLVQFFELAAWIESLGLTARFVLGPVEGQRGLDVTGFPVTHPTSLHELQQVLVSADIVVGNDSGPMHLAGMLGVPGVVLFGPASRKQWGPVGLRPLAAGLPCRPCTHDGRIACADAQCMEALDQGRVRREIVAILEKQE